MYVLTKENSYIGTVCPIFTLHDIDRDNFNPFYKGLYLSNTIHSGDLDFFRETKKQKFHFFVITYIIKA